jgi:hypothetical protein
MPALPIYLDCNFKAYDNFIFTPVIKKKYYRHNLLIGAISLFIFLLTVMST